MHRFSPNAELVLRRATDFAQQLQHQHVSATHLLAALVKTPESRAFQILVEKQAPLDRILEIITHVRFNSEPSGQPTGTLNARAKTCLDTATDFAARTRSPAIRSEHLLVGLLADAGLVKDVFEPAGLRRPDLIIHHVLGMYGLQEELVGQPGGSEPRGFADLCINLNELARQGKLDPMIGRQSEI